MMSMAKLYAGDGYLYLTQQVASADRRRNGQPLVDYYTANGTPAGQWWGKGAEKIGVEGEVTEDQMRAAFGEFLHPNADERMRSLIHDGVAVKDALERVRLGAKSYDYNKDNLFLATVRERIDGFTQVHHRTPNAEEREHIETLVAKDMMGDEQYDPANVRHFIAEQKRQARYPVAGFDLVFTPMKSVSVLWGIGDDATRKAIMKAHHAAVDSALEWVEDNALYTRAGRDGVRKLDCEGMIAAKFVHWDNRAGNPNLHTHCAILNRVYSEGKHRTIDGTVLYRSAVTASEHYNNKLKELIEQSLPVTFTQVEKQRGKRTVWEIEGIPDKLMDAMSRRGDVLERGRELIAQYRETYGREPSKAVQYKLMEQANLETRGAKDEPKSLQDLVATWRKQANEVSEEFTTASVLAQVMGPKARRLPSLKPTTLPSILPWRTRFLRPSRGTLPHGRCSS